MSRAIFADLDRAGIAARHPEVFRVDPVARATRLGVVAAVVGLFCYGLWALEFSPAAMLRGLSRLGEFAILMVPPEWGTWAKLMLYLHSMVETVAIAILGTLGAALLAFPFGVLAAANVIPQRIVHFLLRRGLDSLRAVDKLIWALIWINVVGLGPFAGVLAIICSDFGLFGKLFSEAIEVADKKPVEGIVASGGSGLHAVRFGIIPQILPVMLSQVLYQIESNTRSATIIGIVGAGGIGLHLSEAIRTLEWQQVSFLIILVLIAVAGIDFVSSKLRFAIIGRAATPV